jgi:hypothetical protein
MKITAAEAIVRNRNATPLIILIIRGLLVITSSYGWILLLLGYVSIYHSRKQGPPSWYTYNG